MPDWIRPILGRIVGSMVAAAATWAASKWGVIIPDEAKGQLTQNAVTVMLFVFTTVYALTHKAVSIKTNPTDSAKPSDAAKK